MVPPGGSFLTQTAAEFVTPEQLDLETRQLAAAAGRFMRGQVLPLADRIEAGEPGLMRALLDSAGQLGLLGIEVPARHGGLGLRPSACARIAQAVAIEPSFAVSHSVHTSVAVAPLLLFGSPAQREEALPRLASGEWIGAFALTEPHAGSDAFALRTRAERAGAGWRLSGEKAWITNAAFADLFTVFARTQEGIGAFLIPRGAPGLEIGREERKLGLKGSSTCRLALRAVEVPAEGLLGGPADGVRIAVLALNPGRFRIAASSLGQGWNLLGIAARYARERTAFGRPIGEFGLIQAKLARMAAWLFGAEAALYRTAGLLEAAHAAHPEGRHGQEHLREAAAEHAIECALAKVAASETLGYAADETVQIHGGAGYSEEFPAARAWRDARINRIYEGTSEICRLAAVNLLFRRVDSGRLPLEALEAASPSGTPAERVRGLAARVAARAARLPDARASQHVAGPLADLLLSAYLLGSAVRRAHGSGEAGALALRILEAEEAPRAGRLALRALAELGRPSAGLLREAREVACGDEPEPPSRAIAGLAALVLEAGGAPWGGPGSC